MTNQDAPARDDMIAALNRECFCFSLDEAALSRAMEAELGTPGLYRLTRARCPHLFSAQPVFVAHHHLQRMQQIISAIESVTELPAWQGRVLADAPAIARHDPGGALGVFMGYDFHVRAESLGLIEINTNAGGALLNAALARAQRACCAEVADFVLPAASQRDLEDQFVAMFRREWALSGRDRPLATIAIVDDQPAEQYLYPEFVLFRELFQRHGIAAVIASPEQLGYRDNSLSANGLPVDLVYNRLTDFMLESTGASALRAAYLDNAVVLTPHPRAHALYADKRNLALLTDPGELSALGIAKDVQRILLAGIPHTQIVDPAHADGLWNKRRQLFFKPASGYGSRAAWRGDKLTKRVWNDILAGGYVAQALVRPGERAASSDDSSLAFKFDVRNYVYHGEVLWVAARLYQGQTTNFRTPGGGFAPVYTCPPGHQSRH